MRRIGSWAIIVAALVFLPSHAVAQEVVAASITGVVTGEGGAAAAGVTVTATSSAMQGARTATTNEKGQYRLTTLPPGTYTVTFGKAGFSTAVHEDVVLAVAFTANIDVKLTKGDEQEKVVVAGGSPVVDTRDTALKTNYTSEQLKNIPNARDIWALISESPGKTMARFDVGGSTAGTQTGYTAYGTTDQNRITIEGVNTTEGTGGAPVYFDYGAFDQVNFGASNADNAQMPTPGVFMNSSMKSGGNNLHGNVYLDYENKSLQGDNVTPDLKKLGVGFGTRLERYIDPHFSVGGPVVRDKVWWFTSFRWQSINTTVTGWPFDAPGTGPIFTTYNLSGAYKLTYQLGPNNKILHHFEFGRKHQPYRYAAANFSLDAVGSQEDPTWVSNVEWYRIVSPTFFLDTRVGTFGYNFPVLQYGSNFSKTGPLNPRMYDYSTDNTTGSGSMNRSDRRRYAGEILANWFKENWLGANHAFKFGYNLEWETAEVENTGFLNAQRMTFRSTNGINFSTPYRIELFNYPTTKVDSIWHHGAFFQDQISRGRMTLNLGVRWDYYSSYQPEQPVRDAPYRDFFYGGVPLVTSSGPYSLQQASFVGTWTVPANKGIMIYKNTLVPRLGFTYDVFGTGRTVLKASMGRFYYNPSVTYSGQVNPLQVTTATFGWLDKNSDKKFSMDELGPFVSLTGGARNTVQPDIKQPHTDEYTIWVDHQLMSNVSVRGGFVYKRQKNLWELIDLGRPYDQWTVPSTVKDPGPDGVPGTSDDGPDFAAYGMSVVKPAVMQWQAPDDYTQSFKNVDLALTKRMSNKWSLSTSFLLTWKHELKSGVPNNPNENINNEMNTKLWTFKLLGSYQAPYGLLISPVLRHQAGAPVARIVQASTNAGTFSIMAEPASSHRQDNITLFDVRVEKQFKFGADNSLGVFIDLFNISNANSAQTQDAVTGLKPVVVDGTTSQVPRFLYPTVIISPRIVRFGVKLGF